MIPKHSNQIPRSISTIFYEHINTSWSTTFETENQFHRNIFRCGPQRCENTPHHPERCHVLPRPRRFGLEQKLIESTELRISRIDDNGWNIFLRRSKLCIHSLFFLEDVVAMGTTLIDTKCWEWGFRTRLDSPPLSTWSYAHEMKIPEWTF